MTRFTDFVTKYIHKKDIYHLLPKNKEMTYLEVYDEVIFNYDDNLRSLDEYKEISHKLMDTIINEFGLHLLRIYAYFPYISTKGYHGFDYEELYTCSIDDINKVIQPILSFINIEDENDKKMLEIIFKEEFDNKYGYIRPSIELDFMLKLMKKNFHNTTYKHFLEKDLKEKLKEQKDKYFINLDLTKAENFKELYKTVGEQAGYPEYRWGIFSRFDGYGNVVDAYDEEGNFIWGKYVIK